jgi:hypothetical protein
LTFALAGSALADNIIKPGGWQTLVIPHDGVTDVTVQMQNGLNQGGNLLLPAGDYYVQELTLTNNTRLTGYGARLIYATGAANTNICLREMGSSNIVIEGLHLVGGWTTNNPTHPLFRNTANTLFDLNGQAAQLYQWFPLGLRHGLQINCSGGGAVKDVIVEGFSGIGVIPTSMAGSADYKTNLVSVSGTVCYSNFCGIYASASIVYASFSIKWITNYVPNAVDSQYVNWQAVHCYHNSIGACADGANLTWTGCTFTENYIGAIFSAANQPEDHGSFGQCAFNHNFGYALFGQSIASGYLFTGCQFRGGIGAISMNTCEGVSFQNCQFDYGHITFASSSAPNFFWNNTYFGTWSSLANSFDSPVIVGGNYSADIAGNTDGSPASLLRLGNASSTTNAWRKEVIYGSACTNGAEVAASYFQCNLFSRQNPWPAQTFTNSAAQMLPRYGYLSNLTVGVNVPFPGTTNFVFTLRTNVIPASGMLPGLNVAGLTITLRGSATTPTFTNLPAVADFITANEVAVLEIVPSAAVKTTTNFWWSVEHWYQDN